MMVIFKERSESSYSDGKASVGLGVHIQKYYENDPGWPAYGNDYVKLWVVATGNSREILTYDFDYIMNRYDWHDVNQSVDISGEDGVGLIPLEYETIRFYGNR